MHLPSLFPRCTWLSHAAFKDTLHPFIDLVAKLFPVAEHEIACSRFAARSAFSHALCRNGFSREQQFAGLRLARVFDSMAT
jgi:hypothetical protein